jgi:hypothetical protein
MIIKYKHIPRPSKIYPNWDFGYANKPSGNPDKDCDPVFQGQPQLPRPPFVHIITYEWIEADFVVMHHGLV